ncbi:MAG TPA: TolC family protein [Armatimonadota bacterium]|nr:TolC family protein [Armatimonadota bacterium]
MKRLQYIITAGLVCILAGRAMGRPLSLEEAISTALTNNPQVTAADKDIAVTRTKIAQVRSAERPKLSLNASYFDLAKTPEMKTSEVQLPIPVHLPNLPLANSTISTGSIDAELPLYTGGRVKYAMEQVEAGIDAQQARALSVRREVAYGVIQAYLSAVLAQRVADVAEEAYATIQEHEHQADALFQHGQVPKYEVIRAQTELANQDKRRMDAHNQANLALAYLQDIMGTPKAEPLELTTGLNGKEPFSMELASAIDTALKSSTDKDALHARDRMYAAGEKAAKAEMKPVVAAIACHELYINEQPFTTPGSVVGLVAIVPLYDGGLAKGQVAEQQALHERNQSDVQRVDNGIRLEVRKYYLDLDNARKSLEAADQSVALATESLRLATRRFEEGMGTGVEKSDAILALSIAETNREQARYQYDVSYYGLQKAMGKLLNTFSSVEGTTHAGQ